MEFDFETIKAKFSHDTESKIFVGNADEIRELIAAYEEKHTALEEMAKELKTANKVIKELKSHQQPAVIKKAKYMDLDD